MKKLALLLIVLCPSFFSSNSFAESDDQGAMGQQIVPFRKMCLEKYVNGAMSFVCGFGPGDTECESDRDCTISRCDEMGRCSLSGKGGICSEDAHCTEKVCINGAFGTKCANGLSYQDNAGQRCDEGHSCEGYLRCGMGGDGLARCSRDAGNNGAGCDHLTDCESAKCTYSLLDGKPYCSIGALFGGAPCRSQEDCTATELRCGTVVGYSGGYCSIYGTGALCSKAGVDKSCDKLYCSYEVSKDGEATYKCLPGSSANTKILCPESSLKDNPCKLPEKSCVLDEVSKSAKCLPGSSAGGAACEDDTQCLEKRCSDDKCLLGGFGKKCGGDSECKKKICKGDDNGIFTCSLNPTGEQGFSCEKDTDCQFHLGCSEESGMCEYIPGIGLNSCRLGDKCSFYKACSKKGGNARCLLKRGDAPDECDIDSDCKLYCMGRRCEVSNRILPNNRECVWKRDCDDTLRTRLVCTERLNGGWSCDESLVGEGPDQCQSDEDCTNGHSNRRNVVQHKANFPNITKPTPSPERVMSIVGGNTGSVTLGEKNAAIHVVYFQDLTCGMCRAFFQKVFSQLNEEYIKTGKVKITFVEYSLIPTEENILRNQAAICAANSGKYLEFVENHYAKKDLSLGQIAKEIGIDSEIFDKCVESDEVVTKAKKDREIGTQLAIQGTPEIYVNGEGFGGYRPYEEWKRYLDDKVKTIAKY